MSVHTAIVGQSLSGKSNLAKRFAKDLSAAGHNIIVYDPTKSSGWPENAVKFESAEKFLSHIERAESAFVFIDEAATLWKYDEVRADQILYKRRHQGLACFIISQRRTMVNPNARDQCAKTFAFHQKINDAKMLAQESHPEMIHCCNLKQGEFLVSNGFDLAYMHLEYGDDGQPPTYHEGNSLSSNKTDPPIDD